MKRPSDLSPLRVEMGTHHIVTVDKLFGPMIACDLRIWIDNETCEWVIERERIYEVDGNDEITYEEFCRIPAQESIEFRDEKVATSKASGNWSPVPPYEGPPCEICGIMPNYPNQYCKAPHPVIGCDYSSSHTKESK